MKKLLTRLGLIYEFEYSFELSADSIVDLLKNRELDKETSLIERLVSSESELTSKYLTFKNYNFQINKKDLVNPFSSRGQIIGELIRIESDKTVVKGEVSSYYKELYIVPVFALFIGLLWSPFFYLGTTVFEWIIIGLTGLLIIATILVFYQRLHAKTLNKDFIKYLNRLK